MRSGPCWATHSCLSRAIPAKSSVSGRSVPAQVIKDLTARDKERGLSTGEKKMLTSARQILASELSVALGQPLADVMARIDEQLNV